MAIHTKAWLEFARRKGIPLNKEQYLANYQGHSNKDIFPSLLRRKLSAEEFNSLVEEKEAIYREIYTNVKPVNGLDRVLTKIKEKGLLVALATTAPRKNREYLLEKLGLKDKFEVIVGDEDIKHGKPNPEIYLETAKRIGVNPQECLVFEDSIPGIKAAKAAGMKVVALTTTHHRKDLSQAAHLVKDFTEVDLDYF